MTASYEARIARAVHLQTIYPFAEEILAFYTRICLAQRKLVKELSRSIGQRSPGGPDDLRQQLDLAALIPLAHNTLAGLTAHSPAPLAASIADFLNGSEAKRAASLEEYVAHGGMDEAVGDSREQLIAGTLVQPLAELLASRFGGTGGTGSAGNLCPRCGARPVLGVLHVEGDGGKRFLLCSFCGTEWEFRRILCAYCGETREESLPVYVAEKFPHIRIEACDTCRHCLRTVDLTKDGHAVPVVDDLAAIPLALWAEEYGYTRIYGNLLGT